MRTRRGISKVLVAVVIVVLVALVAGVFVYVWSPWSSPTTSSTSAVSTPPNLVAFVMPTPQTACAGVSYSNSSLVINWGNLAPGTEGFQYLCMENTGTTPVTLAVASTLSPSIGRVTSPQSGTVLNGKQGGAPAIIEIELNLWISPGVQQGPIPAFTITVGAKS